MDLGRIENTLIDGPDDLGLCFEDFKKLCSGGYCLPEHHQKPTEDGGLESLDHLSLFLEAPLQEPPPKSNTTLHGRVFAILVVLSGSSKRSGPFELAPTILSRTIECICAQMSTLRSDALLSKHAHFIFGDSRNFVNPKHAVAMEIRCMVVVY